MSVIGLRVGPYEIVAPAALPGPGDWFLAHHTGARRRQGGEVLVRLLPPDADDRARGALQRQFEALKALEDPRVPGALALYEGSGALVIDPVRGTPLREAISGREDDSVPMTPATLLDVILELADTLQRAHHRGRFHGHLGPDRVLVAPDGALWVLGFGEEPAPPAPWTPPELARGEAASAATDQWCLAALATALVTGLAPWRKPDRAAAGDPEDVVGPVDQQWPALARVLRRMLDPDPAARFPSLHPARQELLSLARKAGGTSDRKELGALLASRQPSAPEPAPEPEPEPAPAPVEAPVPASEQPTVPVSTPEPEPEVPTQKVTPPPPARRAPPPPLPAEEIPVVRPDVVPDEVPVAHVKGSAVEQTLLFPESPGRDEASDPDEEATVLARDLAAVEAMVAPTVVPATDSGEDEERDPRRIDAEGLGVVAYASTGAEWFDEAPRAQRPTTSEPSLGLDADDIAQAQRAPEVEPSPADLPTLRRAVPILIVLLGVLILVWAAVTFL